MFSESFLQPINHSETLLINERSGELEKQRPVSRFGFGQSPFPVPQSLVDALQQRAAEKSYLPVQGLLPLREAVAAFHREQDQVDWSAERVVVGPGSKLLIFAVMAAFQRAEVLLISPSWVSYEPQAHLCGHRVSRIETTAESGWKLTAQQLRTFCEARADSDLPLIMVLNYPGNPTGTTYSDAQLRELADVMAQFNILVISDEIYGMLHHGGQHRSIARYYPQGTVVTGGLSKWCGAGGWRLGVMHVPEAIASTLMPRILGVASETWSCVSSPVQWAAIEAYQFGPQLQAYVERERRVLAEFGQRAANTLNDASILTAEPEGGFYLFPDFEPYRAQLSARGIHNSAELCDALLNEAGVALLPGSAFGMPADRLVARLSYVNFDGEAALKPDADLDQLYTPIDQGLRAAIDWVRQLGIQEAV